MFLNGWASLFYNYMVRIALLCLAPELPSKIHVEIHVDLQEILRWPAI